MEDLESKLYKIIRSSPRLMKVLDTCREIGLQDWRIASGAIYGTVFNHLTNRDLDYGIKDYDVLYFDSDTSYEAEDVWIKRLDKALPEELRPLAELRNQARVHLWFEQKFGSPYPALKNSDESLDRYLCFAHAVAIRLENDDSISIAAPFGLEDIFNMELRHNPKRGDFDRFLEKSKTIQARWPEVKIIGV